MMRKFGRRITQYEVAEATTIISRGNHIVARRTACRLCSLVALGLMYGSYQSRVKLVASALIAVLSDPMAVAKIPAINKPRRPTGIWYKMKWQKVSLGVFDRLGSGCT